MSGSEKQGRQPQNATQDDLQSLRTELADLLERKLVALREEFTAMQAQQEPGNYRKLAPQPRLEGKKYTKEREKLGVTVDAELMRLAQRECRERRISMSRLIDTALWHYLGNPKLSFEEDR
jgi:hypothetical protein